MIQPKTIRDLFSFPGFQALTKLQGFPEDTGACVIVLRRRQKSTCSCYGHVQRGFYDRMLHRVRDIPGGGFRIWFEFEYRPICCHRCKAVKRETLAWLATGVLFTKRAEDNIGRQGQTQTIKQVAEYN